MAWLGELDSQSHLTQCRPTRPSVVCLHSPWSKVLYAQYLIMSKTVSKISNRHSDGESRKMSDRPYNGQLISHCSTIRETLAMKGEIADAIGTEE